MLHSTRSQILPATPTLHESASPPLLFLLMCWLTPDRHRAKHCPKEDICSHRKCLCNRRLCPVTIVEWLAADKCQQQNNDCFLWTYILLTKCWIVKRFSNLHSDIQGGYKIISQIISMPQWAHFVLKQKYICFNNAVLLSPGIFNPSEDSGVGRLVEKNPFL